jgi:threonine/homoserine/homoserine lactone efflux protein
LVIAQAVSHGKKSVLPLVAGVLCGDFVAMSLSLLGLGAVLATSATLFLILKWLGVIYLVYLGIKTWKEKPKVDTASFKNTNVSKANMFKSSFVVTALNPKGIIFFVTFLPQFINPESEALPQLFILMFTFLGVVSITITSFALLSGVVSHKFQNDQARRRLNRIGGGALIGAGLMTSVMQRGQ